MDRTLIDYPGNYGGPSSRAEILRLLKEALALVHDTAADAQLTCAGLRIEVMDPGSPPEKS
jgi:hypothetical protein